jgi:hypothetical protein
MSGRRRDRTRFGMKWAADSRRPIVRATRIFTLLYDSGRYRTRPSTFACLCWRCPPPCLTMLEVSSARTAISPGIRNGAFAGAAQSRVIVIGAFRCGMIGLSSRPSAESARAGNHVPDVRSKTHAPGYMVPGSARSRSPSGMTCGIGSCSPPFVALGGAHAIDLSGRHSRNRRKI